MAIMVKLRLGTVKLPPILAHTTHFDWAFKQMLYLHILGQLTSVKF